MATKNVFEIRYRNLQKLINERHSGNRSEFARAVEKNINLINLSLTPNAEKRRNIGEKLARDLEKLAHLPKDWLDKDHGNNGISLVTAILRVAGDTRMSNDIFPESLIIGSSWLKATCPTTLPENVRFAHQRDESMAGVVANGDVLLVDTSITDINADGLYLLGMGDSNVVTRLVVRQLDGSIVVKASNPNFPASIIKAKDAKKLAVKGRLINKLSFSPL
jgi:hypothetical protein